MEDFKINYTYKMVQKSFVRPACLPNQGLRRKSQWKTSAFCLSNQYFLWLIWYLCIYLHLRLGIPFIFYSKGHLEGQIKDCVHLNLFLNWHFKRNILGEILVL